MRYSASATQEGRAKRPGHADDRHHVNVARHARRTEQELRATRSRLDALQYTLKAARLEIASLKVARDTAIRVGVWNGRRSETP
jgi:hypothetical protein